MTKRMLEEVFKVSGIPTHTFVQPEEFEQLVVALRTPGRGVVVEGPSGIGKTTSVAQAIQALDLVNEAQILSARKPEDVELIGLLPDTGEFGTVIIDDFHKLPDEEKRRIADFMKVLADEEHPNSKVVIVGINEAGRALVQFAHDLGSRLEVIRFETNPDHKVEELLELGESALRIRLNVKREIVEASNGSFYLAQMLAYNTCLHAGVTEELGETKETAVSFESVKGKVLETLDRNYRDLTATFARGTRFRREARAPYLNLLFWLGTSNDWTVSIDQAIRDHPELRGSVSQIADKGYLRDLIDGDVDISRVLHYDSNSRLLTAEDPQYIFYLRNIPWHRFSRELGFISLSFKSRYDFALSFAGEMRELAESLFASLEDMEFEVFYDRNEQHRILGQDIDEYLRPIYESEASFVLAVISPEYPNRVWTRIESDYFKERLPDGEVIPIVVSGVTITQFDGLDGKGRIKFDTAGSMKSQVAEISELLARKMTETRTAQTGDVAFDFLEKS